jgi:hypothetical protein
MKRLLLILLLTPTLCFGAYVDFYCDASTGSNINGGSDAGTVTYTSTNGNWSTVTNIFTPTDGTNPVSAGVTVGQYASIYVDGATLAVYIAKITAVTNAANGTITVSSSLKAGVAPTTSATGRSIKVGGAWKGPNAAVGFPLTFNSLSPLAGSGDKVAVNLKNNASYSVTAAMSQAGTPVMIQGYSSAVRDGGKAIIDGGTSGASYTLFTTSTSSGPCFADIIFQNNGASGSATGVATTTATGVTFVHCVFSGMRGIGVNATSTSSFIECEAFGNNLSNTASLGGFVGNGDFTRCIAHDNTGSNSAGFFCSISSLISTYTNCIADTNGGVGFNVSGTGSIIRLNNCDAYNNSSDGIKTSGASGTFYVENCNLIKNGGWGIDMTGSSIPAMFVYNCGFGSGTQVNTSGTTTGLFSGVEVGSITYASGVTPWADPANGDFRINLATANFAGRGVFTETAASYAGTIGYPDIGAAQSKTGSGGTFFKEVSYGYGQ